MPSRSHDPIDVYVEVGARRAFAGALEWPGWCRSGRDEASAIEAFLGYGPRYAHALRGTRLGFRAPGRTTGVRVVERLTGDATTDFGAPGAAPSVDGGSMSEADLRRAQSLLRACWRAFDREMSHATGEGLRSGPRGGGRDLDAIIGHVIEADLAYLSRIGAKLRVPTGVEPRAGLARTREVTLETLATAVRDGVPPAPRGGERWSPRYFVRRAAWHVLDHAWEIQDRIPD